MDLHRPPRSSSGVGEGVDRHRCQGSPLVKGMHRGGEHGTDAAHGVAHLAAVALPWIGRQPPSSDIRLGGGERGTDLALGVARPMASALPWMTSASQAGHPVDLGTHGGVFDLATKGRHLVDLGTKVTDRPALREIDSAQLMDPVTQVDGSVMMEVLLHLVSSASGQGRLSAVESDGGSTRSVSATRNPSI
jgi:hypothetical protein